VTATQADYDLVHHQLVRLANLDRARRRYDDEGRPSAAVAMAGLFGDIVDQLTPEQARIAVRLLIASPAVGRVECDELDADEPVHYKLTDRSTR
jgi:hypothetical protein